MLTCTHWHGFKSFVSKDRMMGQVRICWIALIILIGLAGCKKDIKNDITAQLPQSAAKDITDLAYGNHPFQKMDVYFPDGYDIHTPVVFMVHGGGFIAGRKEDFAFQSVMLRNKGFIVVNLSYRLVDTTGMLSWPPVHQLSAVKVTDQVADIDMAIRKYRMMASQWTAGSSRMYIAGASAGAILAMLYANGPFNKDRHIRAFANWCGATDLTIASDSLLAGMDPRFMEMYYRYTGAMPGVANNQYYRVISPYYVAEQQGGGVSGISILPANTTVYGNNFDLAFGVAPAQAFHRQLHASGVVERLSVYDGEIHSFTNQPDSWDRLINETATFFNAGDIAAEQAYSKE